MPRKDRTPAWYRNGTPCPRCGRVHERCIAHRKSDGSPCGVRPITGATVCRVHGVNAMTRAKAAKNVAAAEAEAEVRGFLASIGEPAPADYLDVLDGLLSAKHAEVTVVRWKVTQLSEGELVWGTVEKTIAAGADGKDKRRVERAGLNVWVEWLHRAETQLLAIVAMCDKAGMTQKRKEYLERVGTSVALAMRAFAGMVLATLTEARPKDAALVALLEDAMPGLARQALMILATEQQSEEDDT